MRARKTPALRDGETFEEAARRLPRASARTLAAIQERSLSVTRRVLGCPTEPAPLDLAGTPLEDAGDERRSA